MSVHPFMQNAAPWSADTVLVTELAMGLALLAGTYLARRRHYRAHAWCQSSVVVLNLVVIGFAMAPSFHSQLAPKLSRALTKSYYALAVAHAALGTVAEIAGLYIVVAAGTNILPHRWRLKNYRAWMRATLVLWWLVLMLGVATYLRWYVRF